MSAPGLAALPDWADVCESEVDYVYWTLRRFGASAVDAEDLTQEVFLTMWRRRETYDPARPLRAWIGGIAFRVSCEHRRRTKREVLEGFVDLADDRPGADERLVTAQARALVLAALARVPEKQRTVLVMHDLDGSSMRDIARALSVPLFTLYSRLRAARNTFAREVRRRQGVLARPADLHALLDSERKPVPAPATVRRRLLARLRALTPPAPLPAPVAAPRPRWPLAVAAVLLLLGSLSGGTFAPAARSPAGLVGHWTFEDGAGSALARDSSGGGTDCLLRRLDPWQAWRPGPMGTGVAFAGNGWLECPASGALSTVTTELTIAAWVTRGKVRPGYHALVARQLDAGRLDQFMFGFVNGELLFTSHVWAGRKLSRPLPAGLGEWFHVAVTRGHDGTAILYADGVEIGRDRTDPGRLPGGDNPLLIAGAHNGPRRDRTQSHYDGAIDELLIYDRALSAKDIAALAHPPAVLSSLR